jgi:hypothetical protein
VDKNVVRARDENKNGEHLPSFSCFDPVQAGKMNSHRRNQMKNRTQNAAFAGLLVGQTALQRKPSSNAVAGLDNSPTTILAEQKYL